MTTEEKVLQKIRDLFIADNTIRGYVSTRVYEDHVATINEPQYPAISLYLLGSKPRFQAPEMVDMSVQIDIWLPIKDYGSSDAHEIVGRIRALLNRQNVKDTTIGITFMQVFESMNAPTMYEPENGLLHKPVKYEVTAI